MGRRLFSGRVTPRAARIGSLAAGAVAVLVAAGLVWQSAYAGFGASTTPRQLPSVTTGTVAVSDDDAGRTLFSVSGLRPGASGQSCLTVTSTGNRAAAVRLYATGRATTNALSSYLTLTVTAGTRKGATGCVLNSPVAVYSGTVVGMPGDYASAASGWNTNGGSEALTYAITYSLPADTPASAQGGSAKLTFVWEAQPR
jgi:hypothetical protein